MKRNEIQEHGIDEYREGGHRKEDRGKANLERVESEKANYGKTNTRTNKMLCKHNCREDKLG